MRTHAYCLFSIFLFACALFLISGCDRATQTTTSNRQKNSYPPIEAYSELGWISQSNERARVGDYKGKVLVLDFYATWCEPCRRSIPRLNELQARYGPRGLQVVGLNVGGPDDRIKVNDFAKELRIEYALGFPDKSLTDLFFVDDQTIPQTFVFARTGELKKRFIGYEPNTAVQLETAIETELERTSVSPRP